VKLVKKELKVYIVALGPKFLVIHFVFYCMSDVRAETTCDVMMKGFA